MGSKTFDGVWFVAYSLDHPPPHVHGMYAETEVILELRFAEGEIRLADRTDNIRPRNAKRSDVNRIVKVAEANSDALFKLWEEVQP